MTAGQKKSHTLLRLTLAFSVFVLSLVGVLYVGFALRFPISKSTKEFMQKKSLGESENAVFYDSLGDSTLSSNSTTNHALADKFTLELVVYQKQELAEQLITELEKKGIKAYYSPFNSHGRVFFRVRTGIFLSEKDAENEKSRLKISQNLPITVVKLR